MKKTTVLRSALPVALAVLTLSSCASMMRNIKLGNPDSAFIAVKREYVNNKKEEVNGIIEIHLENPFGIIADRSIQINDGLGLIRSKEPYDLFPIKKGTYKIDRIAVRYTSGKTTTIYYWNLPAKDSYVFKINPGEVFYIGDYKLDTTTSPETVILSSNMEECKDTLVARHPELDGFVWLTPDIDRSPF